MKTAKAGMSAQNLQWILVGLIVFGLILGGVGSWYLNTLLATKVAATNDAVESSKVSSDNLERAQRLQVYLQNHKDEVDKAAQIVAQTTAYRYQNQIVEDVTKYATIAGVSIIGFDFPQDIASATVDKTTGLKSLTATIRLSDSSRYTSYLTFLKYIEQNLTKIQITDITISPNLTNQDFITDTTIGIQVYVQ
jgi:hypothetical protein